MADIFNNDTGEFEEGGDGIPDDQAKSDIKAKMRGNQDRVDAEARAAAMGGQADAISGLTDDQWTALLNAQVPSDKKVDESYKVALTSGDPTPSINIAASIPFGSTVIPKPFRPLDRFTGIDTLLGEGFLGVNDKGIIDAVVGLGGGKTQKYDSIYKAAVAEAAYRSKAGKPTAVSDVLARWTKAGLPKGLRDDDSGGGAFSSTNRVVSLSDEGTARQLINNSLSRYLGREATAEENDKFLKALNVQEKQNPSITVSKGYTDGSGNTTQSQNVSGGMNREDFAQRFARSQQGYAEYQTATTYLDAFINALDSDSRVI